MKRKTSFLVSLVLLLVVSLSSFASAAQEGPNPVNPETIQKIEEEMNAISPFVKETEEGLYFDEKAAREEGLSEELIKDTVRSFEIINEQSKLVHQKMNKDSMAIQSNCQGKNSIEDTWYGYIVYLDSCNATLLSNYLWGGVSASALGTFLKSKLGPISAKAVSVVVGAIMGIGAAAIGAANSWGTGVGIRCAESYISPDIPFFVWPQ
ncbi:hypothetical protein ABEV55_18850 [Aneurinibacillus thermoaerophilus]|uniref:hypothetical protein n=1 Tax=Aneurinibacillus thermoaerophilus TaxID=143495 RepID=UPI002E1BDB7E|nr:hypothetical protein [Aneurinibacillus thermoaerophilus]